ncbi:hypothetical protein F5X68DRAFT_240114 [Plectosphaerella plurivora]|uniref:Uncharacterized protein n=1 Tax=Plectosphaerella plurivora TaxID=936078 RepID=A0A9P8VCE2_9PEZI|nr:hypothetical protein F5X68DRAFT_240114 [Plectosphaerella plurivora]
MPDHPMVPHGSQLRVHREIKPRGSDLHAPKPPSPPSMQHDSHDIEEADLFSTMSSKDSTAAHGSVFSKHPAHQQQSTSRSTTPDAPDQEQSVRIANNLLTGIGVSHEDRPHRDYSRPVMTHRSPRHTPALCKKSEDSDRSADSSDTEIDHDLEADADRALSEWYGIRLRELPRPIRVVHLFEEVKEKCTEILEVEGFGIFLDDDDTPTPEEDEQPAQDGSAGSAPTGNPGFSTTLGHSSATPKGKRRCGEAQDDGEDAQDSADHPEKTPSRARGPYKKHRNPEDFSCPYRKRNPLRFNVSEFESCANRSYETISLLKLVKSYKARNRL